MAAFADPQGAVLSVWEPKENIGAGLVNVYGALSWNDDLPRRRGVGRLLPRLFGWEISELEGSGGQYWSITNGGRRNAGMMPMPPGAHSAWNLYFACDDADATIARAGELGGATVMGPIDVPDGSRFAVLRDRATRCSALRPG